MGDKIRKKWIYGLDYDTSICVNPIQSIEEYPKEKKTGIKGKKKDQILNMGFTGLKKIMVEI